jgi:hypothetical protein
VLYVCRDNLRILTFRNTKFIYIIFTNSVRTSYETHYVSAKKTNQLMLFGEIVPVYCENPMKHINILCGQNSQVFNVNAGGTYNGHCALKLGEH